MSPPLLSGLPMWLRVFVALIGVSPVWYDVELQVLTLRGGASEGALTSWLEPLPDCQDRSEVRW